jgi:hypothetical protein
MSNTTVGEVFDCFESSFQDKNEIPAELELIWLKRAIARYCVEIDNPIALNAEGSEFDTQLDFYTIDLLAQFMKQSYQEREVSKVNKRVSIVGKDLSVDGNNGSKTAAKNELDYIDSKNARMTDELKPPAYN